MHTNTPPSHLSKRDHLPPTKTRPHPLPKQLKNTPKKKKKKVKKKRKKQTSTLNGKRNHKPTAPIQSRGKPTHKPYIKKTKHTNKTKPKSTDTQ